MRLLFAGRDVSGGFVSFLLVVEEAEVVVATALCVVEMTDVASYVVSFKELDETLSFSAG